MDLKQLEIFVQVAELGSFTRAAAALRQAQPGLSRQVRALELELRQPLFDRNGRGVTLTDAGTRLLAHGRGILQQVQRARQDLADARDSVGGRLAVGLPPSLSRSLTAPLVAAFAEQLPRATLSVVEGLSAYALEWLVQGRIDCAVVYRTTAVAGLNLRPVCREPLALVRAAPAGPAARAGGPDAPARRRAPADLRHLARCALVIPSRPHAVRMQVEAALAAAGLAPRIALEIDSVPAILDLVERNPALHAVLSPQALRGREAAFVLRALPLQAELSIATSTQRPGGALVEQGTALLAELLLAGASGVTPAA